MLTQQLTKPEGSVRLIESVLRALGQTLPEKTTGKVMASRQTSESILSFYRFARASQMANMDFDKIFQNIDINSASDEEIDAISKTWVANVNRISERLEITGEEQQSVNALIGKAISPLGEAATRKGARPTFGQPQQQQQATFGQQPQDEYERYLQAIGAK